MQINLPLWTFAAHLPAAMAIATIYGYAIKGEYDFPMATLSGKDRMFYALHSIAMGTLFSTVIAAGTPKFHSTFRLVPNSLRSGTIVLCHLAVSTLGMLLFDYLKPGDDHTKKF